MLTSKQYGFALKACQGKLYITAENLDGVFTVERYDPSVNSWACFTAASTCSFPAVVNFQGFLFVVGGQDENNKTVRVHKYNPDTPNVWQEVAPLNTGRHGLCHVADRSSLYAIGGLSEDGELLDVVEKIDSKRNRWSTVASTLAKNVYACGAVVRGKVFVFGGLSHENLIETYDPATNM